MRNLAFGLTVTVMGIGVTILTLFLLTQVVRLLVRLFPYKEGSEEESET